MTVSGVLYDNIYRIGAASVSSRRVFVAVRPPVSRTLERQHEKNRHSFDVQRKVNGTMQRYTATAPCRCSIVSMVFVIFIVCSFTFKVSVVLRLKCEALLCSSGFLFGRLTVTADRWDFMYSTNIIRVVMFAGGQCSAVANIIRDFYYYQPALDVIYSHFIETHRILCETFVERLESVNRQPATDNKTSLNVIRVSARRIERPRAKPTLAGLSESSIFRQ